MLLVELTVRTSFSMEDDKFAVLPLRWQTCPSPGVHFKVSVVASTQVLVHGHGMGSLPRTQPLPKIGLKNCLFITQILQCIVQLFEYRARANSDVLA